VFQKPWVTEAVLFFAVLWQEDFRLDARTRGTSATPWTASSTRSWSTAHDRAAFRV